MRSSNKGAVELSMNFLVLLIIAIVVFGMSIWFITTIFNRASDIDPSDLPLDEIQCGNQRVCLSSAAKMVNAGKWTKDNVITLRILNVGPAAIFTGDVILSQAVDADRNQISSDDKQKVHVVSFLGDESYDVLSNELKTVAIGFKVDEDAVKGTYLFTIIVNSDGSEYDRRQFTLTVK